MRRIILESPFAGRITRNIAYARLCARDALRRGETVAASHLLYTQPGILDDTIPEERALGIAAGLEWRNVVDASAIYADFGYSSGMLLGKKDAEDNGRPCEERLILTPEQKAALDAAPELDWPMCWAVTPAQLMMMPPQPQTASEVAQADADVPAL